MTTGQDASARTEHRADATIPGPRTGHPPEVTVLRDPAAFAALADEWQALHRRCAAATAFQTHAWLHSWWLSYGRPGRLRVVLVRRGGVLVGAAALTVRYRGVPVWVPVGAGISDYADVLVDPADPGNTAALADALRTAARGAVIDLREVRPGAAAERMYDAWRGPRRRLPDSVCLELPGRPMDDLIARVGSSSRGQRIRSNLRRLDAAGVTERDVPPDEVASAVAEMLRLHLLQWQGRGVNPEHVRPRFRAHLTRACTLMAASGDAVVSEFTMGGEVVAANLTVLSPALAGGYLYGAHPSLRGTKVDVTTLLMRHGVRHAAGGGREVLSLLRGAEPHKFHWRPEHVTNHRLLLAARPLTPVLHLRAALAQGRTRLAARARRHAPVLHAWRSRLNDWRATRP
ncbi:GNAT family N-acetyltransferase [Streptomyces sp. NPDC051976]|uniref:GNAT family N-acetyltransferase n=1 Tax=Streptomyces sp. NPDC051976 TaxID=3154947 RepID=UPI0034280B5E